MAVPFVRSRLDVFSTGPDVTSSDAEASLSTPLNLACMSSDCGSKAGEPGENLSVGPGPGVQVWSAASGRIAVAHQELMAAFDEPFV